MCEGKLMGAKMTQKTVASPRPTPSQGTVHKAGSLELVAHLVGCSVSFPGALPIWGE